MDPNNNTTIFPIASYRCWGCDTTDRTDTAYSMCQVQRCKTMICSGCLASEFCSWNKCAKCFRLTCPMCAAACMYECSNISCDSVKCETCLSPREWTMVQSKHFASGDRQYKCDPCVERERVQSKLKRKQKLSSPSHSEDDEDEEERGSSGIMWKRGRRDSVSMIVCVGNDMKTPVYAMIPDTELGISDRCALITAHTGDPLGGGHMSSADWTNGRVVDRIMHGDWACFRMPHWFDPMVVTPHNATPITYVYNIVGTAENVVPMEQ